MKRKNFLFILIFLTVSIHLSLYGQATNLSKSNSESFWPAIAANSKGEIMVIFTEIVPGNYTDIFYTISKDGGKNWTQPVRTYSRKAYIKACALAADSNGNFHMAYADGYGSGGREVYYRAYINGNWGAVEQLSYSNDNSNWCRICTDGNTVHVAWYQERGWPLKPFIALKSKSIGATWPSNPVDVSLNPSNGAMYPDIKAKFGNIYVIYVVHEYSSTTLLGKHLGYSERINGVWKGPTKLGWGTWPAIDVDAYGNALGFYPSGSGGGHAIYKAKIDGNWNNDEWINDKKMVSCFFDIKYKSNFIVASYMQESSINPKYYSIYYNTKQYKSGWGQWSASFEVEPGYYAELPKIDMDGSGNVHVIWADSGYGNKTDIYYKKVALFQADKPYIDVDKSYLSFSAVQGESPKQQTFQIRNSGVGTLSYNIFSDKNWLIPAPLSGQSNGEWDQITVLADSSSLSPGNYSGKITISSPNAPNSPIEISVNLLVGTKAPSIDLDNDSLSFSHVKGSSNPPSQSFSIRNFGLGTLNYQINTDMSWVSLSSNSGSSSGEWDMIEVSVDASSLGAGDNFATITITSPEADNSPQQLEVLVEVTEGGSGAMIQLDKSTMNFKDANPQYFKIRNSGGGTLNYSINTNKGWITVSPKTGNSDGEWNSIKVTVNASALPYGIHTGTITITSPEASNSPRTIKVTLTIQKPRIQFDRTSMDFYALAKGSNPESQSFRIRNSKSGSLNYSIQANQDWLKKSPGSGTSTGEWDTITVSVNTSSLPVGNYNGRITVNASGAENTPQHLPVHLKVDLPPYPYPPLNTKHRRIDNIGLIIQDYINEITWSKNPKNEGIFNIVKFRIYRKLKTQPQTYFMFLGEVESSHPLRYYDHFSSKEERDKYIYAVTEVNDQSKESQKAVTKLTQ
jgi:hypothetical protein